MKSFPLPLLFVALLLVGCGATFSPLAVQNRMEDIDEIRDDDLSQAAELETLFKTLKENNEKAAFAQRFDEYLKVQAAAVQYTTDTLTLQEKFREAFVADMRGSLVGIKIYADPLDDHVRRLRDKAKKLEENNRKSLAELQVAERLATLSSSEPVSITTRPLSPPPATP